jgi:hypothetical protein
MDLALFARVIWRHKLVLVLGAVLAIVLGLLSYVRVGRDGTVTYRDSESWVSYETVSVTQPGFTEGRLNDTGADPNRLTSLAVLYSHYIDTDAVHTQIWPHGVAQGASIQAAPVLAGAGSSTTSALPIISIAAFSRTPVAAQELAARTTKALSGYIEARQVQANVPVSDRVELEPVKQALSNPPTLWQARSKSLPIVIFLTALMATFGLAFILENLDPQISPVTLVEEEHKRGVGQSSRVA